MNQDKTKIIMPVAWHGIENGELGDFAQTSREVVERALSSREPVVVRNRLPNPAADSGKLHGGSYLALPILSERDPLGVLMIYAAELEAFVEPELAGLVAFSRRIAQVLGPNWQKLEKQAK